MMKISRINGNDIVDSALTEQFKTYAASTDAELVRLKNAIDEKQIISEDEFKDFKKKLDAWKESHESDASSKHEEILNELRTELETKYTTNENLEANYAKKEELSAYATQDSLNALTDRVNMIAGDDAALDSFKEVKDELTQKLNSDVFIAYKAVVNSSLESKADSSQLDLKLDKTSLDEYKGTVANELATKANVTDLEASNAKIAEIQSNKFDIEFKKFSESNVDVVVYGSFDDKKMIFENPTPVTGNEKFTAISKSGETRFNGQGKFVFKVTPKEGYKITRVKVDKGEYKNIKLLQEGTYEITDIKSDIEILITAVLATTPRFNVSFVLSHGTVKVYSEKTFTTPFDDVNDINVEFGNNVYFELVPDVGYSVALTKDGISGAAGTDYKNLKTNAEENYGNDNMYAITKITKDIVVTPVFTMLDKKLEDYAIRDAYTKTEADERFAKSNAARLRIEKLAGFINDLSRDSIQTYLESNGDILMDAIGIKKTDNISDIHNTLFDKLQSGNKIEVTLNDGAEMALYGNYSEDLGYWVLHADCKMPDTGSKSFFKAGSIYTIESGSFSFTMDNAQVMKNNKYGGHIVVWEYTLDVHDMIFSDGEKSYLMNISKLKYEENPISAGFIINPDKASWTVTVPEFNLPPAGAPGEFDLIPFDDALIWKNIHKLLDK